MNMPNIISSILQILSFSHDCYFALFHLYQFYTQTELIDIAIPSDQVSRELLPIRGLQALLAEYPII